jgi:phage baseplate assembly protein W
MKTFALSEGDLVIGPRGFMPITGSNKLRQDLGVALREPVNADRFHPGWGSALSNYVGNVADPTVNALIVSEIARVLNNYVAVQRDLRQRDATNGRINRFSPGEIIQEIKGITVTQSFDSFNVRIALVTLSQDEVVLHTAVMI